MVQGGPSRVHSVVEERGDQVEKRPPFTCKKEGIFSAKTRINGNLEHKGNCLERGELVNL